MAAGSLTDARLTPYFNAIGPRYVPCRFIDGGSYGSVIAAWRCQGPGDVEKAACRDTVAVKKLPVLKQGPGINIRIVLREVWLLAHLEHENIINIQEIILRPSANDIQDVYIVQDYMDLDLFDAINGDRFPVRSHEIRITYEILRGLKFLHSAKVIHRDIKPENILLKLPRGNVKICDLGSSRILETDDMMLTVKTGTFGYQSPEILVTTGMYSEKVDVWSTGVVLAEFFSKEYPLFPRLAPSKQLEAILKINGKPSAEDLEWIWSPAVIKFIEQQPNYPRKHWSQLLNTNIKDIIDLIGNMLKFNPQSRLTVQEALEHKLFDGTRQDEPIASQPLSFGRNFRDLPLADAAEYFVRAAEAIKLRQNPA